MIHDYNTIATIYNGELSVTSHARDPEKRRVDVYPNTPTLTSHKDAVEWYYAQPWALPRRDYMPRMFRPPEYYSDLAQWTYVD